MTDTEKQEAYLEEHASNFEDAYAITTQKVAELRSKKDRTEEEDKDLKAWEFLRKVYAVTLANNYLETNGYVEKRTEKGEPYLEKEVNAC